MKYLQIMKLVLFIAVLLAPSLALADKTNDIKGVSFFFLGGDEISRPATGIFGDKTDKIRAHQISILHLKPATKHPKAPIVMLPGFGLAVEYYLQKLDGREGWAMQFVRHGYPVYLVELSHTTRSGIDTGFYLKHNKDGTTTQLFSWGAKDAWSRWGLGPKYGVQFKNSRFNSKNYDQVVAGFTGIETDRIDGVHNITYQLESNVTGLTRLLKRIGPATLLVHSAAGVPGFEVARLHPELVNAVINIEPVGCPADEPANDKHPLHNVAVLSIFGDHMEVRRQMPARQVQCQKVVDRVKAEGLPAAMISLPSIGIKGNSHLMMLENNSTDIADMMLEWLSKVAEKTRPAESSN